MRREVRISGFGGQGIILAGYILGKAAAVYDNKEATLVQSYGPEARGGAASAEVVIDEEPVDYPHIEAADILVLMSAEAYRTYGKSLRPGGTLIVEEDLVPLEEGQKAIKVPATRLAEELGRRIVANIVMLGALVAATGIVSKEAIVESVRTSVPPRTVDLNLRALERGYEYVKEKVRVL
ncbi:MAG: 2-oxoacid:acceptor oxidoreductase family protein [Armatimonadota bacterium]|nr:2-oxoacid:acceptor oxidoreductase family protein [Armatimonadota bacterium]MDR5703014.1 2-oxoacid:acceptor oxidoreductase family protein [Armatimonadota bacterium]MDR7435365.1 2-oxoacid:acceptor oxidoreductase family protein [Armatimonadota bacterium]